MPPKWKGKRFQKNSRTGRRLAQCKKDPKDQQVQSELSHLPLGELPSKSDFLKTIFVSFALFFSVIKHINPVVRACKPATVPDVALVGSTNRCNL